MKLTGKTGTALILHNDILKTVSFGPGYHSETHTFDVGGDMAETEDYDPRFDVYYRQSDDGATCHHAVRVLELNPESGDAEVPDPALIASSKLAAISKVVSSVAAHITHPDDLGFAVQIFNSSTWQHKYWEDGGKDLDVAHAAILKDIFQIS
jgi:hypothetical protein